MAIADECTMAAMDPRPDGAAGPAEWVGVAVVHHIVRVGRVDVNSKARVLRVLRELKIGCGGGAT